MKTLLAVTVAIAMMVDAPPEGHRTLEQHYSTTPTQQIEMRGFSGSRVRFRSWDKNEVSVRLEISFSSSDDRGEQKSLDAFALKETRTDDRLRIDLQEPDMSRIGRRTFWGWLNSIFSGSFVSKEIEGEIYVPRSNPLSAEVKYGSVEMDGMKGELDLSGTSTTVSLTNCSSIGEVKNDYGRVTIENGGGTLRLSSKSTTIVVDRFDGKAVIDADYSNITVRDVTKSLSILSKSGTIKVDHVGGDVSIHSPFSNISAYNIAGMLDIEGRSGRVTAKTVDGVKISAAYSPIEVSDVSGKASQEISILGQSGNISLRDAVGNVRMESAYGKIDLENIRGNVDIKGTHVEAYKIIGDWRSETQYGQIIVRDLSAKRIIATCRSGKIDMTLKTAPSELDIKNEYADVNVDMPSGFSGDVDLNVTYGNIHTNLPLSKEKSFQGGGAYAMGKIGSAGGKFSIETRSANINVKQR